MRDQNADDVMQANDVFRMCLDDAENTISQRGLTGASTDTIVAAATAMMGFIATSRLGRDVKENL